MKTYVLDTDILTLYQAGHSTVTAHVLRHSMDQLAVTIVSVEEQLTGWYTRLRRAKKRNELARVYQRFTDAVRFLTQFQILSFTEPAIIRFEDLVIAKVRVARKDLRIAAIALECHATVATRNLRDFCQVPGLGVEDWSV